MAYIATSISNKPNTRLPQDFHPAHELCFVLHDIMLTLLKSGEAQKAFHTTIKFDNNEEAASFNEADNIFAWLEGRDRRTDQENVLVAQIFPAALADGLGWIYEALETSRKGKLSISYSLIRKVLQETLYLFECMLIDRADFAAKIISDPTKLSLRSVQGRDAHADRVRRACELMNLSDLFDAKYISDLRYNKYHEDSFGGICDKATHLFTDHKAVRTEALNVNFIFSNHESRLSQWNFFYSRLPYLLFYFYMVVEFLCSEIAPTSTAYIEEIMRRITSSMLIWWGTVSDEYAVDQVEILVSWMRNWLIKHCEVNNFRFPNHDDLIQMADNGAFPGENEEQISARRATFESGPTGP